MVPVLNKIDLPTADIDKVKEEIEAVIGIDAADAVAISAKTGLNVGDVLEAIVAHPAAGPRDTDKPQALIIDSWFDNYLGVVSLVRVMRRANQARRQDAGDEHRARPPGRRGRRVHAQAQGAAGAVRRRSGLDHRLDQGRARAPVGDTLTLANDPRRAAARLPGDAAAGVRRPVPGRCRGLPGAARGAGQAAPQRRRAALRAGELGGDGLRLPLRLPRHAAHGDRQERLEREYDLT